MKEAENIVIGKMKNFLISARSFPSYISFVRVVPAANKDLAMKEFFALYGSRNIIDRIVEMDENEEDEY